MESNIIELKKMISKIRRSSLIKIKPEKCIICNRKISSTCKSHSVPQFILKNISSNGNLYNWNKMIGIPIIDNNKGIREANVFRKICNECDNTRFKEYETPDNYKKNISNVMLYQISIKILLNNIYTREASVALTNEYIEQMIEDDTLKKIYYRAAERFQIDSEKMTIDEEYRKLKLLINSSSDKIKYKIIFTHKLSYVVPYAFQDEIVLVSDMVGGRINNIFSKDKKYLMQSIKISIFPMKDETFILMYRDQKDTRYNRFERQFCKLSLENKLALINYIVFLYSEKFLISDKIDSKAFETNITKYTAITQHNINFDNEDPYTKEFRLMYRLDKFKQCENLLLEKYALIDDNH